MYSAVFTATAGSAAEGKVRDSEEPGSLLFYLRRCHGIQGRKTQTHTQAVYCEGFYGGDSNKGVYIDSFINRTTCVSC